MSVTWDRDEGNWTAVPNQLIRDPDLSAGAKIAWVALASYDWQDAGTWVGQERIAEELGCSDRQLRRVLGQLEAAGYLKITHRGKRQTNLYRLMVPGQKRPSTPDTNGRSLRTPVSAEEDTEKKTNKKKPSSLETDIYNFWVEETDRDPARTKFNTKRLSLTRARLREGLDVDDLCDAIRGAMIDPWMSGKDKNSPGYTDLTHIFRDGAKVEQLRDVALTAKRKTQRKAKPYDREALIERQMTLTGESREEAAETVDERRRREVAMA